MNNRVYLGPSENQAESFAKLLAEFDRKGHPVIVFVEPRTTGKSVSAYLYRFFAPTFTLEMPVLPRDKERTEKILSSVGVLIDTLGKASEDIAMVKN